MARKEDYPGQLPQPDEDGNRDRWYKDATDGVASDLADSADKVRDVPDEAPDEWPEELEFDGPINWPNEQPTQESNFESYPEFSPLRPLGVEVVGGYRPAWAEPEVSRDQPSEDALSVPPNEPLSILDKITGVKSASAAEISPEIKATQEAITGAGQAVSWVLDQASRPGRAVLGGVSKAAEPEWGGRPGDNLEIYDAIKAGWEGRGPTGAEAFTKMFGKDVNPVVRDIAGFGLELATDPTTFIPVGALGKVAIAGGLKAGAKFGGKGVGNILVGVGKKLAPHEAVVRVEQRLFTEALARGEITPDDIARQQRLPDAPEWANLGMGAPKEVQFGVKADQWRKAQQIAEKYDVPTETLRNIAKATPEELLNIPEAGLFSAADKQALAEIAPAFESAGKKIDQARRTYESSVNTFAKKNPNSEVAKLIQSGANPKEVVDAVGRKDPELGKRLLDNQDVIDDANRTPMEAAVASQLRQWAKDNGVRLNRTGLESAVNNLNQMYKQGYLAWSIPTMLVNATDNTVKTLFIERLGLGGLDNVRVQLDGYGIPLPARAEGYGSIAQVVKAGETGEDIIGRRASIGGWGHFPIVGSLARTGAEAYGKVEQPFIRAIVEKRTLQAVDEGRKVFYDNLPQLVNRMGITDNTIKNNLLHVLRSYVSGSTVFNPQDIINLGRNFVKAYAPPTLPTTLIKGKASTIVTKVAKRIESEAGNLSDPAARKAKIDQIVAEEKAVLKSVGLDRAFLSAAYGKGSAAVENLKMQVDAAEDELWQALQGADSEVVAFKSLQYISKKYEQIQAGRDAVTNEINRIVQSPQWRAGVIPEGAFNTLWDQQHQIELTLFQDMVNQINRLAGTPNVSAVNMDYVNRLRTRLQALSNKITDKQRQHGVRVKFFEKSEEAGKTSSAERRARADKAFRLLAKDVEAAMEKEIKFFADRAKKLVSTGPGPGPIRYPAGYAPKTGPAAGVRATADTLFDEANLRMQKELDEAMSQLDQLATDSAQISTGGLEPRLVATNAAAIQRAFNAAAQVWADSIKWAAIRGEKEANRVLFDYRLGKTQLDSLLNIVTPFSMWQTRNPGYYADAMIRNPWIFAVNRNILSDTEAERRRRGLPVSRAGQVSIGKVGGTPESDEFFVGVSPLAFSIMDQALQLFRANSEYERQVGLLRQGKATEEDVARAQLELTQSAAGGLGTYPHIIFALQAAGLISKGYTGEYQNPLPQVPGQRFFAAASRALDAPILDPNRLLWSYLANQLNLYSQEKSDPPYQNDRQLDQAVRWELAYMRGKDEIDDFQMFQAWEKKDGEAIFDQARVNALNRLGRRAALTTVVPGRIVGQQSDAQAKLDVSRKYARNVRETLAEFGPKGAQHPAGGFSIPPQGYVEDDVLSGGKIFYSKTAFEAILNRQLAEYFRQPKDERGRAGPLVELWFNWHNTNPGKYPSDFAQSISPERRAVLLEDAAKGRRLVQSPEVTTVGALEGMAPTTAIDDKPVSRFIAVANGGSGNFSLADRDQIYNETIKALNDYYKPFNDRPGVAEFSREWGKATTEGREQLKKDPRYVEWQKALDERNVFLSSAGKNPRADLITWYNRWNKQMGYPESEDIRSAEGQGKVAEFINDVLARKVPSPVTKVDKVDATTAVAAGDPVQEFKQGRALQGVLDQVRKITSDTYTPRLQTVLDKVSKDESKSGFTDKIRKHAANAAEAKKLVDEWVAANSKKLEFLDKSDRDDAAYIALMREKFNDSLEARPLGPDKYTEELLKWLGTQPGRKVGEKAVDTLNRIAGEVGKAEPSTKAGSSFDAAPDLASVDVTAAINQPVIPVSPKHEKFRGSVQSAFGDLGSEVVNNMMKIMAQESPSADIDALNSDGEYSKGLFQINAEAWPGLDDKYNLFNPVDNAKAAREVYDAQGYGAWHIAASRLGLLGGRTPQAAPAVVAEAVEEPSPTYERDRTTRPAGITKLVPTVAKPSPAEKPKPGEDDPLSAHIRSRIEDQAGKGIAWNEEQQRQYLERNARKESEWIYERRNNMSSDNQKKLEEYVTVVSVNNRQKFNDWLDEKGNREWRDKFYRPMQAEEANRRENAPFYTHYTAWKQANNPNEDVDEYDKWAKAVVDGSFRLGKAKVVTTVAPGGGGSSSGGSSGGGGGGGSSSSAPRPSAPARPIGPPTAPAGPDMNFERGRLPQYVVLLPSDLKSQIAKKIPLPLPYLDQLRRYWLNSGTRLTLLEWLTLLQEAF